MRPASTSPISLPRARVFVHHGGQNSMMDALSYEVPQVIVLGASLSANAEAVENVRCGLTAREPAGAHRARCPHLVDEPALTSGTGGLRAELSLARRSRA